MNSLAKAIQDKWEATTALNDLLDVSKLYYGTYISEDETYPFATLTEPGGSYDFDTNTEDCWQELTTLRITVYFNNETDDYNKLSNIMQQIRKAYKGFNATLDNDEGGIANTIPSPAQYIQDQDDGWWTGVMDLNLMVTRNV